MLFLLFLEIDLLVVTKKMNENKKGEMKKKVFLLSLLIVISLSFRPSQSPSYDLGCFCRIEKVWFVLQDTCGSIIISHTRART